MKSLALLVAALLVGAVGFILIILMSLGSSSGSGWPYIEFGALILVVGALVTAALKLQLKNTSASSQKGRQVAFFVFVTITVGFVIGNVFNHFYTPAIFRVAFCAGMLSLGLWFLYPLKKWLALVGLLGVLTGVVSLFYLEDYYRTQYYSECEHIEPRILLCNGLETHVPIGAF